MSLDMHEVVSALDFPFGFAQEISGFNGRRIEHETSFGICPVFRNDDSPSCGNMTYHCFDEQSDTTISLVQKSDAPRFWMAGAFT